MIQQIKSMRKICLLLLLLCAIAAKAQVTTSSVNGVISDSKGDGLPGATVQIVHIPTNTKAGAATNVDGRFFIANLAPGGPYEITISFVGYNTEKRENVFLKLGEASKLEVQLKEESTALGEVVVTGIANKDSDKIGSATSVGKELIQGLPTLSRSFADFTKLTPQSSNNSFAGTNFRYNNITLDGAINNDAIGFSPSLGGISGTANQPGSSTRTNSFSLDAIQEVQVQIAPYDVSLGNFTGGSINAVSRSGSNNVEGSVYLFGRNSTITGNYKGDDKVNDGKINSSYSDYQTGFRLGLPLIKNKLFWFTNEEVTNSNIPLFFPSGASGYFMDDVTTAKIITKLSSLPASTFNPPGGYDPGGTGDYSIYSKSTKFFNRFDWNINDKHQLTIRNNTVVSEASNLERSSTEFQFGGYDFVQKNTNTSTVLELKSRFSNTTSNSLIVGYTDISDSRNPVGTIFPQIQISGVNGSGTVLIGTNREAGIFNMKQKTFEFTDNFKKLSGNHIYTFGTHNEFYSIDYTFVNSWNGRFDYPSLNSFLTDVPNRMRAIYYPSPSDNSRDYNLNNSPGKFNVGLMSLYAQDEFSVNHKFQLTYGLRADMAMVPNSPSTASHANFLENAANYGNTYTYDNKVSQINNKFFGDIYLSPRVGFKWDVKGDQSTIIRGGSGLFTGRIPFAWIGYTYLLEGSTLSALDLNPPKPGTQIPTDPTQFQNFTNANQPGGARRELDIIDNNFQMPRVWRSNLAVDFNLSNGYKLTLEGIYTKTIKDVVIKQINLKDSAFYASYDENKQQPLYAGNGKSLGNRVTNAFSSIYLITNTNQGERYQLTAQLSKTYPFGLGFMVAYTYGQSKDVLNGIRNSPESGWQLNQNLNPNSPLLSLSNFDIRNRIVSTVQYQKKWSEGMASYVSLVFTAQSGSPFTYVLGNNNLTRNGQQIDLAYIPKNASELTFTNRTDASGNSISAAQQAQDFDTFISNDDYLNSRRGQFAERNGGRTPWNNQLDIRFMHDFNFKVGSKMNKIQVTFDIINLTNLLNKDWGLVYFVPNTRNGSVNTGLTANRGANAFAEPTFNFTKPTATYSVDQFSSRWQGQAGVRYIF